MSEKAPFDPTRIKYGFTRKIDTACGSLYITINSDDNDKPYEIFISLGKSGGCMNAMSESLGRLVSLALQNGVDIKKIHKSLYKIRCPSPWNVGSKNQVLSCIDAVSIGIKMFLEDKGVKVEVKEKEIVR